jgi:hypothetical protein
VQKLEQDFEVKETLSPAAKSADAKGADAKAESKTGDKTKAEKPERPKEDAGTKKTEEAKTTKLPLGSYIIRMDQPYSRMADMLLDTQYYSTSDPRPYDDTGWTLGPLRNVKTVRITDAAILKAPMTLVDRVARFDGGGVIPPHSEKGKTAAAAKFYVINATGEPNLATLRFRLKDVKFFAAEEGFEAAGQKFVPGTFILPLDGNPPDLDLRLNAAARELGVRVTSAESLPEVARHEVAVPRIALMHNWTDTQNEGWFRLALEETGVPYAYISDINVRNTANLREKYDVILFPPTFFGLQQILNGIPARTPADGSASGGPIPWQNSSTTPNFGGVDEAADIRGGLGFDGLAHLKKFIEDGGLFVPIGPSAHLPIDVGLTDTVSISDTHQLQARGMIARATVEDKASPITYGYDDSVGVYFNQGPVFSVSVAGRFGRLFGAEAGSPRPSGRGSMSDPDIPQGRLWTEPEAPVHRSKAEQELYVDPDMRAGLSSFLPPPSLYPRVVLRFAGEKDLWISGMLAGGSELAESPAIVDVPVGRGHVVLFATNPMWRQETQGSFMLLLNAALHFDHLNAGRKTAAPATGKAAANGAARKP